MRIGAPSISQQQDRHVLSAKVEVASHAVECPETLWYVADVEESPYLPDMADAFVVGLVVSAMYLGEDVWVEGNVSTRVANGLETYQGILSTWWPDSFKRVDVHYENLVERRHDLRPAGVGCTFSGGVDSFHAVLQMLPTNSRSKDFGITHALMINGFDQLIDLERRGLAQKVFSIYQSVLKAWNVELLMLDTNLIAFRTAVLNRMNQVHSYSGPLAAGAHALGGLFGRFGICGHGNYAYEQMRPFGSHVALDHHLSSDHLQIFHAGTSHSRAEKTELIAGFPQVQRSLRVCSGPHRFDGQTGMPVNCCQCSKCARTMIALMILGKMDKFVTFSKIRPPLKTYQSPKNLSVIYDEALKDLAELAHRHGQQDWVEILNAAREKRHEQESEAQGAS